MGTALRKPAPWVEARFGVAVRTGFRCTDESTGRTVEMLLCPHNRGKANPTVPDQSGAFFAEVEGGTVYCTDCSKRHPVIDFSEAEEQGLIATRDTDANRESGADGVCASAVDIARAIRLSARGKRATARG